jgi:RHS repeat-associated protein
VFLFDAGFDAPDSQQLELVWTPADSADPFVYASVVKQGAQSTPFAAHAAGVAGAVTVALPDAGYAAGDTLQCALRAVRPGMLGNPATLALQIVDLGPGPVLHALQLDSTGYTANIAWDFDDSRFNTTVTYRVSVIIGGVEQGPFDTPQKAQSWTAQSNNAGSVVTIRVRAITASNLGVWSEPEQFLVGSTLGAPGGLSACVSTSLTVTAAWASVTSATGYKLELREPSDSTFYETTTVGNVTTTDWLQSDTHLEKSTAYTLTLTALAGNDDFGPASDPFPFNSATQCPGNNGGPVVDPINQITGQYLYTHTDLTVPSAASLEMVTYYTSPLAAATPAPSALGPNWSHNYDVRLKLGFPTIAITLEGAHQEQFSMPTSRSGECAKVGPPNGDSLVANFDGSWTLTRADGRAYAFDQNGTLQSIAHRNGNALRFSYTGGKLTSVSDVGSGRALAFQYQNDALLSVSFGSLSVGFSYDSATGDLKRVTNPGGAHRDFSYATGSLLLTLTDENGHLCLTNTYYADRRVYKQTTPRGLWTLTYQDGADANGFKTVLTSIDDAEQYTTQYFAYVTTQRVAWELVQLTTQGGGDVQLIGRVYDGLNRLLQFMIYQGPPPAQFPPLTPPSGNTWTYGYDGQGNMASITTPCGTTQTATYNADNTVATSTDELGYTTTYVYVNGLLHRTKEPLGYTTVIDYADFYAAKNLVQKLSFFPGNANDNNAVANVFTFDYHTSGSLKTITAPGGASEGYVYDPTSGWQSGRTTYDPGANPVLTEARDLDPAMGWTNKIRWQFGAQTLAQAYLQVLPRDNLGQLSSFTDALGNTVTYEYTDDNFLQTATYPAINQPPEVTAYTYDGLGRLRQSVYAASLRVAYRYYQDSLGRPTSNVDANGNTTTIAWAMLPDTTNAGHRLIQSTTTYPLVTGASDREQVRQSKDPIGQLVSLTNVTLAGDQDNAPATTWAYATVLLNGASVRSVTRTSPPSGNGDSSTTRVTLFDARGRVTKVTDDRGNVWTAAYDTVTENGIVYERVTATDPLGNASATLADPFDRIARREVFGPNDTVISSGRIAYDALGRHASTTETDDTGAELPATTTGYAYNAGSGYLDVTVKRYGEPTGSVYSFDGASRLRTFVDAAGLSVSRSYLPNGRLASYTNGRGQTITYGYDVAGRFVSLIPPSGASSDTIAQILDANGKRLHTQVGGTTVISRRFDELGRQLTRTDVTANETVTRTWWPGHALKTLAYPGLNTPVSYFYDDRGRMKTVQDWLGLVTTYGWYPTGQLASAALPGGISSSRTIDDAGRLVSVVTAASDGTLIQQANYTLDAAGRPSAIDWVLPLAPDRLTGGELTMVYAGDRLVTFDNSTVQYDGDGNATWGGPLMTAMSYDERNRVTAVGGMPITYDADGLRQASYFDILAMRPTWDATGYGDFYGNLGDSSRGVVGATGARTSGGAGVRLPIRGVPRRTEKLDDALYRPLAVTDANGVVQGRYVYGVGLIATVIGGEASVHVFDELGSTVALADAASGTISQRFAYDPFGALIASDAVTGQVPSNSPFLFHGQWSVSETLRAVQSMGSRDYQASAMRFAQRDAMFGDPTVPQTLNRYAFVGGNPLRFIDPLGYSQGDHDHDHNDRFPPIIPPPAPPPFPPYSRDPYNPDPDPEPDPRPRPADSDGPPQHEMEDPPQPEERPQLQRPANVDENAGENAGLLNNDAQIQQTPRSPWSLGLFRRKVGPRTSI